MSWRHAHQQLADLGAQLVKRTFDGGRASADEQQTVAEQGGPDVIREDVAEAPAQAIAGDCGADRPTHGERHPGWDGRDIVHVSTPQRRRRGATTMAGQRLELSPRSDPTDQADRRLRPLSRRALMIARPERVRMRARKPCLRARRRLFGWKVRFTAGSGHDGRTCRHGAVVAGGGTATAARRADRPRLRPSPPPKQRFGLQRRTVSDAPGRPIQSVAYVTSP